MIKRLAKGFATVFLLTLLSACAGMNLGGNRAEYDPQAMQPPPAPAPPSVKAETPPAPQANAETPTAALPVDGQPAKIALLLPLTGPQAALGQAMLQAAQLALFDLGSHSFQLLPRDTGDTADGAAQAAEEAVHDGAQLILGPIFAPAVRAATPVAARAGINMIAFSNDATLAGGNTYVIASVPANQIQRVVQYGAGQGIRRIGVLAAAGDYGDAVLAAYTREAGRDNIQTVETARLPAGAAQMSTAVAAFAHGAPTSFDAVLIAAPGEQAKQAASLLTQNGLPPAAVRRLGTGLWDDPGLASSPDLQNAWFAASPAQGRASFEQRYNDTYGQKPPRLTTLAYDATALAAVLSRKGDARQSFSRAALINPNGFAGIDGVFRFLPSNIAERGLGVLTFHNGAITVQDPPPQTFQKAVTR